MRILLFVTFIAFSFVALAQNTYQTKVNEAAVPKVIPITFKTKYNNPLIHSWYTSHINYWYNDYSDGWYNNWYGTRTIVIYPYQQPNYYEVVFTAFPGEVSHAIYNKHGVWYETRTRLTGLPLDVVEGLAKTKYADWKRLANKERIESASWPGEVYRFKVSKGMQAHIIRIDAEGNLIQEQIL